MEKSVSVNDFIGSLPKIRIRKRRFWNVIVNGQAVCGVKAINKNAAMAFAKNKYPNDTFELIYIGYRY